MTAMHIYKKKRRCGAFSVFLCSPADTAHRLFRAKFQNGI